METHLEDRKESVGKDYKVEDFKDFLEFEVHEDWAEDINTRCTLNHILFNIFQPYTLALFKNIKNVLDEVAIKVLF